MVEQASTDSFGDWIGRSESQSDGAAATPLASLAALLDHDQTPWSAGNVPPLGHWLYFLPQARQSEIGPDGHPKRGGFLPPISLPRRMWAGGRLEFLAPVKIGAALERISTIKDIRAKRGASGDLLFVTLRHEISADGMLAITEEQDLVYRGESQAAPAKATPAAAPEQRAADATRTITPDPVLLFRYSALTFNGHRIHYDRNYAGDVEGYQGLVVQGPLLATLLADHFLRVEHGRQIARFSFRAQKPLLDTAPFELCLQRTSDGASLWTRDAEGAVTMSAEVVAA